MECDHSDKVYLCHVAGSFGLLNEWQTPKQTSRLTARVPISLSVANTGETSLSAFSIEAKMLDDTE